MNDRSEMSSRDYEREAEASRHRLASNLRQLTDRLTPGQVIDEVLTYAKGGGGTFLKAFSNAAKDNPIPSLLMGAGLLMFLSEKTGLTSMLGHQQPAARYPGNGYPDRYGDRQGAYRESYGNGDGAGSYGNARGHGIRDAIGGAAEAGRNAFGGVADAGRNAMSGATEAGRNAVSGVANAGAGVAQSVGSGVHSMAAGAMSAADQAMYSARRGAEAAGSAIASAAERARYAASGVGAGIADTADNLMHRAQDFGGAVGENAAMLRDRFVETARETPRRVSDTVGHARDNAMSMVGDQPLMAGAVGLAIGAAIAALLPKTDAEDQLVGEASDTVKRAVGALAAEQMEAAKSTATSVASKLVDKVNEVADEHGVSPGGAAAVVQAATDKLKEAVGLQGTENTEQDTFRSDRF